VAGLSAGYAPIAYSCAKAAVLQLTRVVAPQLATRNIRVNAVCPGLVPTAIFGASAGLPCEAAEQVAAVIREKAPAVQPTPRAAEPRDVAEAVLYLASDAAGFVTGTHLVVDGGLTVGPRHAWDPNAPNPIAALLGAGG
jgi:NAD(P)-dependent dehydrogenase (short-subunit alcohol dehydrogenase family)